MSLVGLWFLFCKEKCRSGFYEKDRDLYVHIFSVVLKEAKKYKLSNYATGDIIRFEFFVTL